MIRYELKDLDVSKLPEIVREQLGRERTGCTPYHTICYEPEKYDKPTYSEGTGKDIQFLMLEYTLIEEDGTPKRVPAYKTDENGNNYKVTDDHIANGFTVLKCDPSELTYPLNEYFDSIKRLHETIRMRKLKDQDDKLNYDTGGK